MKMVFNRRNRSIGLYCIILNLKRTEVETSHGIFLIHCAIKGFRKITFIKIYIVLRNWKYVDVDLAV